MNLASPTLHQNSLESSFSNHRAEEIDIEALTSQQTNSQEAMDRINSQTALFELEAKLHLKRKIVLFIAIIISSFSVLFISKQALLRTLYIYCIIAIVEHIVTALHRQRESWRRREDLLYISWIICCVLLIFSIDLKFSDKFPVCTLAALPFWPNGFLYVLISQAPANFKRTNGLLQYAFAFQVFVMTAYIDELVIWDWRTIIIFGLYALFGLLIICMAYMITWTVLLLIKTGSNMLEWSRMIENENSALHNVCISWSFLSHGTGYFAFYAALGITGRELNQNDEYMKFAASKVLYLVCPLVIYTLFMFRTLIKYFQHQFIALHQKEFQELILIFETQKQETYFEMVSSTYFVPLCDSIIVKNKLQKIKELMASVTSRKIVLDTKQPEDKEVDSILGSKKPSLRTFSTSNLPKDLTHLEDEDIILDKIKSSDTGIFKEKSVKIEEPENFCYICCSKPPNVVLANCGHGGICYDCAVFTIKKRDECMQCRNKVEAIHKIDLNRKYINVVKGIEVTKIIKTISS